MGRPIPRRYVAVVCIAAVLFAAFMPGAVAIDLAVPEPAWTLLPDLATLVPFLEVDRADLYSFTFVAPVQGRAPPAPLSTN